jgi:hypothetical protein
MPGVIDYATTADVAAVLPNVTLSEESAIWTTYLHVASRGIDSVCDRSFGPDGAATKYFDIPRSDMTRFVLPVWAGDFYTVTSLKVALVENADPVGTNWRTISGDGITPPSNFYLGPENPDYIGTSTSATATRPFYQIDLPSTPNPNDSTNYITSFTKGLRTLSITASWGFSAVPDVIKTITVNVVVRMWKAKEAGFLGNVGSPEIGTSQVLRYLDFNDRLALNNWRRESA